MQGRFAIKCKNCGEQFETFHSNVLRGGKFCSRECYFAHSRSKRVNEKDGTARCARCKQWKPIADFVKGVNLRPHSYCKRCSSTWFHERNGTPVEKRKSYRPAYRLTDEEKRFRKREANRLAHHARRAAGPAPNKYDLSRLYCEQDARCAYCRTMLSEKFHVDHKQPVSRGGKNDIENLQFTCPRCNIQKGAMTHEEFLVSKKRRPVSWA